MSDKPPLTLPTPPQRDDRSTIIFLGLYLLLLAFFIMLVSVSSYEEARSRAVIESLSSTFDPRMAMGVSTLPTDQPLGAVMGREQYFREVGEMIAADLPLVELETVDRGRTLKASLPLATLFRNDSATVIPGRQGFLLNIANLIARRGDATRFDVEILVDSGWIPPNALAAGDPLPIARAAAIAQIMAGAGAPADSLYPGVGRTGEKDTVQFYFYVRGADEGMLSFDSPSPPRGEAR